MANENAEIHINYDEIPDFEIEHMCRTVSAAVNRLLQDPKNKADFEQWRKARAGVKA
jgi:hypothetical protein